MNIKTVYVVQGFQNMDPVSRNLLDLTTIEVYATTEKEAVKKAKKYIKKKEYRIAQVIEIDPELRK